MKTVSFNVRLPDKYYKFSITKRQKCTIIEPIEDVETGVTKRICPNQLVYAVKEFNLLNRFRRRIYGLLKRFDSTVLFIVTEPLNGGLIDYAWYVRLENKSALETSLLHSAYLIKLLLGVGVPY